jgi:hypothetical protein
MEHGTIADRRLFEHFVHIPECIAAVDDHGLLEFGGESKVRRERSLLIVAWGELPVVVKPTFSDGVRPRGEFEDRLFLIGPV